MRTPLAPATAALLLLLGCSTSPRSQERVRNDTAAAAATIKSDVKAAALGIRDGLNRDTSKDGVDINSASKSQLEALPGVTPAMADEIILHRPYSNASELRQKHILPKDVYSKISGRLTTHS